MWTNPYAGLGDALHLGLCGAGSPMPDPTRAGVRHLLFNHIIPRLPSRALEGPWRGHRSQIFHGTIRVGHDGDFLSLPLRSDEVRRTNRLAAFK